MTIPTARIFDSERATGAQAGALAGARFCDTALESQIPSKIVANDERTVNSVVLHLYAVFIGACLSCLEPRSLAGLFVCLAEDLRPEAFYGNSRLCALYRSDRDGFEGSGIPLSGNAICPRR